MNTDTDRDVVVKTIQDLVVLFSGDSGDGMQLAGNMFSTLCAVLGDDISTFPDYPAEIRAPQGTLGGVSGFKVHAGKDVLTPGDHCDVLVAMNPAALKRERHMLTPQSIVIIDVDTFTPAELKKAEYTTEDPFEELGIHNEVIAAPFTQMCLSSLAKYDTPQPVKLKSRNMMALGLLCWIYDRPLEHAEEMLRQKFASKPQVAEANIRVLRDGYNYGHNVHASISVRYKIEPKLQTPGTYTEISGNRATAYGLIAAAEKAGLELFLGSYPITPATDILHELAKHKSLGVKTVQCEDELSGICMAIGASYAGDLGVTSTSGPGLALKSEALNLAVMAELPLVVIDVQRGGPSTGLPTKTEQADLLQALFGRNGESPVPVVSPATPADCFECAYMAAKVALEHMTPVILLSDAFLANGSASWKLPDLSKYPPIAPHDVTPEMASVWTPYRRDPATLARYRAVPGTPGFCHVIGGLEKDAETGAISYDPDNHERMISARRRKVELIDRDIPQLSVRGAADADTLVIGWGGTYGHILEAVDRINRDGSRVAFAHLQWINPLPSNTEQVLRRYKQIIVCELNCGQLAAYLRMRYQHLPEVRQVNRIQGQPFIVDELVDEITNYLKQI
ncbi:MAG: 2-oxoacid:acceptor oxidoreductase subunit alpha [Prevotellaceae bacterium]|nr:2-oxoacid:acceptor oxidoreductase subunit alpha [Prevotellaceae bacterium]MDY3856794.1 2-oxoacid:acceptor oxidoreductase subunit alpha [Bacteroidaceae bacterium]